MISSPLALLCISCVPEYELLRARICDSDDDCKSNLCQNGVCALEDDLNLNDEMSNNGGPGPEDFVLIPSGTFMMGSPTSESGRQQDETIHSVTLTRSFWMSETEVTQGQWRALMGNNPSNFSSCGDDCPVENVNWWEAIAYANELSEREGLEKCFMLSGCSGTPGNDMECLSVTIRVGNIYDCEGYRLPTETEWEYAARAGATTAFHSGSILDTQCNDSRMNQVGWYCGNSNDTIHRVKGKGENDFGLYDMHGNVWEWVFDGYDTYPGSSVVDYVSESSASERVLRGGSWDNLARHCRAAYRSYFVPGARYDGLGFRLSRSNN